jgi:DNA-directed RNA polymerase specialized sigma24 family protein
MRLDGYSAEEIATEFGIVPNAVYQRVNRIMNKLRNYATRL